MSRRRERIEIEGTDRHLRRRGGRAREIERSVLDGSSLAETILGLGAGPQTSVSLDSGDGETVRFRMSEDLHVHFRWVEKKF